MKEHLFLFQYKTLISLRYQYEYHHGLLNELLN